MPQTQTERTKDVIVELNDKDVKEAYDVGRGRDGVYAGKGAASIAPGDRTKIHIMGAKGEYALARYWNIPPNDVVLDKPDPGFDYEVAVGGMGFKIDVKATKYFGTGDLIVKPSETSVPDTFVLVGVDGTTVRLVGYMPAGRLTSDYDTVDDFAKPVYRLARDELKPLPAPGEVTVIE